VQLASAAVVIKDVFVSHSFGSDIVLPLYAGLVVDIFFVVRK
jgi:hypothetical protein